jgi:hypothetical protein
MKVCPVRKHGLAAVTDHLTETGEILGKGTDALEGYDWIDGNHYGPGQKPRITMTSMAVAIDPTRAAPPTRPTRAGLPVRGVGVAARELTG